MLQRLIVLAALVAVALLVPLRAQAAILPACEIRDQATLLPPVPPVQGFFGADAPDACASLAAPSDDAAADVKVAALCDPRGASAIAPARVLAVSDARIEATPGCASQDVSSPTIGPAPGEHPAATVPAVLPDAALSAGPLQILPASTEALLSFIPIAGAARSAVAPGIYHPPR